MKIHFTPHFSLTPRIQKDLRFIESVREKVLRLAISSKKHEQLIKRSKKEEMRAVKRIEEISSDKHELTSYLAAYDFVIECSENKTPLTEQLIKKLHARILGQHRASPYRRGQNAVYDSTLEHIVYLPPKPKDVGHLMKELVEWIHASSYSPPITAAVAHFGINSIHPYYDGNGRCARLLTKLILNQAGYGMHGMLSLENYYYKDLEAYYAALSTINHQTYYKGPATKSLTKWLEYFCSGMAYSCKKALKELAP